MTELSNRNQRAHASAHAQATTYDVGLRSYMLRVYNYMAAGLGLTGVLAYVVSQSPALLQAIFGGPQAYLVMFAPIIFVMVFSFRIHKMSEGAAKACFFGFAAVMGISLSTIFVAYTQASVARAFFITASLFGVMSLYGYTTKRDLTGMGNFLIMGVVGIFLASIVNLFLQSAAIDFAVSIIGVIAFTGLTAYDTQKIKETYYLVGQGQLGKAAIMGALSLYLDFINLMLMLLRLFGDRR